MPKPHRQRAAEPEREADALPGRRRLEVRVPGLDGGGIGRRLAERHAAPAGARGTVGPGARRERERRGGDHRRGRCRRRGRRERRSLRLDLDRREARAVAEVRLVRDQEPRHDLAADQVLLDDLRDVVDGDVAVPDLLGVHDHRDPVLALIEAPRVVGADLLGEPALGERLLQPIPDLGAPAGLAAPLGVLRRALVDAHEDVTLEARHPRAA